MERIEQLAGMKHLNRLEQVLARSRSSPRSAAELLVFSSSGFLRPGTMSNVFLVQEGRSLLHGWIAAVSPA